MTIFEVIGTDGYTNKVFSSKLFMSNDYAQQYCDGRQKISTKYAKTIKGSIANNWKITERYVDETIIVFDTSDASYETNENLEMT